MAADFDSAAGEGAEESSAAGGDLSGFHLCFAEAVGPVRDESGVGAAGDWVFWDALGWGEKAADEVDAGLVAGGGYNDGKTVDTGHGGHVRSKITDLVCCFVNGEVVSGGKDLGGWDVEAFQQMFVGAGGGGGTRREIKRVDAVIDI